MKPLPLPIENLKEWNLHLYIAVLEWRDANEIKFRQVTQNFSLAMCTTAQIAALCILVISAAIEPKPPTKGFIS